MAAAMNLWPSRGSGVPALVERGIHDDGVEAGEAKARR